MKKLEAIEMLEVLRDIYKDYDILPDCIKDIEKAKYEAYRTAIEILKIVED